MATQREIEAQFLILQTLADEMVGSGLPPAEAEKAKQAVSAGLFLAMAFLVDVNRIAESLEWIARNYPPPGQIR